MVMYPTPLASSGLSVSASRIRELAHIAFNMKNVLKYKTIQKPVYTIVLLIIGVCIYKEKITIVTLIGVMLLLFGIFLIEKSKKD